MKRDRKEASSETLRKTVGKMSEKTTGGKSGKKLTTSGWALLLSVIFLVAVVMPLAWIAFYNYPSSDDFAYAGSIYWNVKNGAGLWTIFRDAYQTAVTYYQSWQGRYFDDLVSAFGFGIAIPKYYFVGTFLVLLLFLWGNLALVHKALYKILKWDNHSAWIAAIWFTAFQLLYVPYAVEGFYWYVGATGYTMTYALMLLMLCTYYEVLHTNSKKKKAGYILATVILVIMIAGSNYAGALLTAEILVLFLILTFAKKAGGKQKLFAGLILAEYLICFAFNALSPGNTSRMDNVESYGVVGSVLASLKQAAVFCKEWFHIPVLFLLVFLCVLGIPQLRKSDYQWKLPGVFTLVTFGLMASLMTPPFYAGATWGPGRLINLVYYSYYFFLVSNLYYWIGWGMRKFGDRSAFFRKLSLSDGLAKNSLLEPVWMEKDSRVALISVILLGISLLGCMKIYGLQSTNSTSAMLSIVKGEAAQYRLENEERWKLLDDESLTELELDDFTVKPYVLYHDDITEDPDDWRNTTVKGFFHKDYLKLRVEE